VIPLAGGGWGYGRQGPAGISPAAIVLIILVILLLTGNVNFNLREVATTATAAA
jgi:hypothetical protein